MGSSKVEKQTIFGDMKCIITDLQTFAHTPMTLLKQLEGHDLYQPCAL